MNGNDWEDYLLYNGHWIFRDKHTATPNVIKKSNKTVKPKSKPAPKKADNIHVYQDQDYINTLSGVTKIAVVAISELVNQGKADFLFLRDEEVKDFWDKHLVKIVAIREAKKREEREKEMRTNALAKLTPEEKKLLGIK
jgi:hypothetical protein